MAIIVLLSSSQQCRYRRATGPDLHPVCAPDTRLAGRVSISAFLLRNIQDLARLEPIFGDEIPVLSQAVGDLVLVGCDFVYALDGAPTQHGQSNRPSLFKEQDRLTSGSCLLDPPSYSWEC